MHDRSKLFACDKCDYSSTKEANLREHVLDKHSNFSEEILKPHVCEVCGFRFKSSCHLIRHLKIHNRDVMKPYLFKCEYCNSSFTERYNLRVHIEIKHKQKPFRYVCNECKKGFHGKKDLELHSVTHQIDPVIHQCSECDFKSKHVKSIKRHYKAKHCNDSQSITKRFKCDICDKKFENRAKLKRHYYVHKDKSLRPTACSECSYRCIEKSELKRHMEVVHGSLDAPGESGTKGSADVPGESGSKGSTDVPGESGSKGSADVPGESGSKGSADALEEGGSKGSADALEEGGSKGSADAPKESGTKRHALYESGPKESMHAP
jgi:stress-induced morphogen